MAKHENRAANTALERINAHLSSEERCLINASTARVGNAPGCASWWRGQAEHWRASAKSEIKSAQFYINYPREF